MHLDFGFEMSVHPAIPLTTCVFVFHFYLFSDGGTFSWMNSYRESFIPVHRTNSQSSIGQSSNSSGLVPDYDHRSCEKDVVDRVHKLKVTTTASDEMSFRCETIRQLGAGAFGTVSR